MQLRVSLSSFFALLIILPLVFSACNSDDEGSSEPARPAENIIQIINTTEGLDSLASYLGQPGNGDGIANRLSNNEHTLFAPNNAAFAKLLNAIGLRSMSQLRSSLVSDILLYHIVANTAIQSNQLDSTVTAFNNGLIALTTQGDSIVLNPDTQPNRTTIVAPDIAAANGVVHVINEVLLPPGIATNLVPLFGTLGGLTSTLFIQVQRSNGELADGGLTTIGSLIGGSGSFSNALTGSGPTTILAPINEAFSDYLFNEYLLSPSLKVSDIASYHVIPGNVDLASAGRTIATQGGEPVYVTNLDGLTFLNGTPFYDLGYAASNGKLLLSTEALKPPVPLEEAVSAASALTGATFNIFTTALEQTDLDIGTGKTIFVPTDQAFQEAGLVSSIDSAARVDPTLLANILQTHVFEGINFSSDVIAAESLEVSALNGTTLTISIVEDSDGAFVRVQDTNETSEDAAVVQFDNLSTSGVMHVIDKVLLP